MYCRLASSWGGAGAVRELRAEQEADLLQMQSSNETFEKGHFKGHLKHSGALKRQRDEHIVKLLWELGVLSTVNTWQEPFR